MSHGPHDRDVSLIAVVFSRDGVEVELSEIARFIDLAIIVQALEGLLVVAVGGALQHCYPGPLAIVFTLDGVEEGCRRR